MSYLPRKVREDIYFKTVIPCVVCSISDWGTEIALQPY